MSDSDTGLGPFAVDLMNPDPTDGIHALRETLSILPPPVRSPYSPQRSGGTAAVDDLRSVQVDLRIRAADPVALHQHRRAIELLLGRAERATGASGGDWTGSPVSLWVQEKSSDAFVFFDVLSGSLAQLVRDLNTAAVQTWRLTLSCLPFARGTPRTYQSGTLVNGLAGSFFIADVPGDTEALCQITLTDVSTGGQVINGVHFGRRSLRGMASGDFTPVVAATALAPGTTHADATALNGVNCARVTASAGWQNVGTMTVSGAGLNHGRFDALVLFRASSAVLDAPLHLAGVPVTGTGSLPASVYPYQIIVTELDASGNETIGSDPIAVLLIGGSSTGQILLTWTPTGSPTNHRVYFSNQYLLPWRYFATGSAAGAYTLSTTAGSTPATPPSMGSVNLVPPELQAAVSLGVATPQWGNPGDPFSPVLGAGAWEYGYAGVFPLPPMPEQEGRPLPPGLLRVQAQAPNGGTPTVDVGGCWFLPHTEPQLIAEWPGLQLGTARTWILDTRRDERVSGLLTDGASPVGQVVPRGPFLLAPGGNLIVVAVEGTNGAADTQQLRYTLAVRVVPRYLDVTGVVS